MSVSIPISVDVRLVPESTAKPRTIRGYLLALLERTVVRLHPGLIDLRSDPALASHCISARVSLPARCDEAEGVPLWKANVQVFVYRAYDDVSVESFSADGDDGGDGEGDTVASHQYALPSTHFEGLWESLFFSSQIQDDLMRFAASSLRFAQRGVDPTVIAANRVILLHGPPGTGKTTLCKALAQRLSIRLNSTFPLPAQLIEVNAHSLFSKWFSESGKLVQRLFERVEEAASEEGSLVFVLIDEVESLAGSRGGSSGGSGSGSEPSDALRSVNALLTQLDRLQRLKNVLVLTTSNLTGAIDAAFLDRADVRRYIGPPGVKARYEVLRSCLRELARTGVLTAAGGTSAGGSGPVDDGEGGVSAVLLPFDAAVRAAPAKLRAALAGFDGVTTEAPPVPVPTPAPAPESRTGARAGQSMCEIGPTTVSSTPEFGPSPPIDSASPLCRDSSTASAHQDSSSSNRAGVDYVYKALAARAHSHHTPQAAAVFQKLSAAFAAHPELLPPETAQEAAAAEATAAVTAAAAAAAAAPGSAAAADATGSADRGGNDATAATAGILPAASGWLLHAAVVTCGLSGRSLRKLPLQAHAFGLPDEFYDDPDIAGHPAPLWAFAAALETAARQRLEG